MLVYLLLFARIPLQVLTTGFWPTYKSTELALPQEMVEGVELFKQFYEVRTASGVDVSVWRAHP